MDRWVTCLVVALLAAGCTRPSSAADHATAQPSTTVDAQRGTGQLHGLVLDEEQLPVPDVKVQIVSVAYKDAPPLIVYTNQTGGFLAKGLEGGTNSVYASKKGFTSKPLDVEVVVDGSVEVRIQLTTVAVLKPFHETIMNSTSYSYALCVVLPTERRCSVGGVSGYQVRYFNDEAGAGPLESIVVESEWAPTADACAGHIRTDLYGPGMNSIAAANTAAANEDRRADNPHHWDNLPDAQGPTHLFVPRRGDGPEAMFSQARTELNGGKPIATSGTWRMAPYPWLLGTLGTPVDVECMIQQTVTFYITAFHVDPAPSAEWSIFAEAT